MRLRKAAHESKLTLDLKRPWDRSSTPPSLRRTVTVTLRNRTAWLDRDLAKLVRRVMAIEEVPPGHLTLTVTYGRGGSGCSGVAGYRNWQAVVRVPSPASLEKWGENTKAYNRWLEASHAKGELLEKRLIPVKGFPIVDFCHVVAHEIGHAVFGKKHAEMGFHYRRGEYSNKVFAWAKVLTVRLKAVPKAPSRDKKREAELKRAEASVAKYERRIKLDQTLLKKWKRRVRVLERRMAVLEVAAEKPGGEPCRECGPQTLESGTKEASSC